MEPLCYHDDEPLPAKAEILRGLNGHAGREAQLEVLRLLCPCRNTIRDPEVWRFVIHLSRTHYRHEVRDGAHHAVKSLRERARIDTQTAALVREIGAGAEQRRHGWLMSPDRIEHPKPVRNDVPTIIEMLASDDATEPPIVLPAPSPAPFAPYGPEPSRRSARRCTTWSGMSLKRGTR